MRADAEFTIDSWQQDALDDAPGTAMARSTTEILLAGSPEDANARAYVGVERISGTLAGHAGSFVLIHSDVGAGDASHVAWTILPGSGTDERFGISGTAEIAVDEAGGHAIRVDYRL
jgi:hypothetical protein